MADPYKLEIKFRGVCTHFHHSVLPGVQHRVVLPDATPVRFGTLVSPSMVVPPPAVPYTLMPHFPRITMELPELNQGKPLALNAGGILEDGNIVTHCRLAIVNTVETEVTYPADPTANSFIDNVLQISTFVPHYSYSSDVVLGGRASAYFDLRGGTITTVTADEGAVRVIATLTTDGPPQLQLTPFHQADPPAPIVITLPGDPLPSVTTLVVNNFGPFCFDGQFDYLLHLLTAVDGIPPVILRTLPGIEEAKDCIPRDKAFDLMKDKNFPRNVPIIEDIELMASCSDSRYP